MIKLRQKMERSANVAKISHRLIWLIDFNKTFNNSNEVQTIVLLLYYYHFIAHLGT